MTVRYSHERALVVAAVTGVLDRCGQELLRLRTLDWEWTLERLDDLGIRARFWSESVRARVDESIPDAVRGALRETAEAIAARSARLVHLMLRAGTVLDAEGIRWVPIKGAALAVAVPAYSITRQQSDVDLLVHPDDLVRAADGLRRGFPTTWAAADYGRRDLAVLMRASHSIFGFRDVDGALIELHHALPGQSSRERVEQVMARATRSDANGRPLLLPSVDDLLGIACVHVLEHHRRERRMLFRHLSDVAELLGSGASGPEAARRYDRAGLAAVHESIQLLALARDDVLGRGVRSWATKAVAPSAWRKVRIGVSGVVSRAADSYAGIRSFGLRAIVPPRSFMVDLYGPAASGPLLPLLHLYRWGAIVVRLLRR